jgi:hypothetical protein
MALVAKPQYQEVHNRRPVAPVRQPRIDEAALAAYGCDVSFTSDDSTPADELVARAVERAEPDLKHLIWNVFDRVRADYDRGEAIFHPAGLAARIDRAAAAMGVTLSAEQARTLLAFFNDVNHVLFQHQALSWLASDANFKLHLYGRGWERHPRLARHARGPIRDERMRHLVFRASKINLSVGPYGAVTPRLLEGVAQGAFFLVRFCAADVIERFYPPLVGFCAREGICSNAELAERATPGIRVLLAFASRTLGVDVLREWADFVPHLLSTRAQERGRGAGVLWPEQYGDVCFGSRDELLNLVGKFLYDEPQRRRLAGAMRDQLINPAPPRVSVQVTRTAAAIRRRDDVAA